jgi:hypothetical protein
MSSSRLSLPPYVTPPGWLFEWEPTGVGYLFYHSVVTDNFPEPQDLHKFTENPHQHAIILTVLHFSCRLILGQIIATDKATFWTKCSNPVTAGLFCFDNTGQINIIHLYLYDEWNQRYQQRKIVFIFIFI